MYRTILTLIFTFSSVVAAENCHDFLMGRKCEEVDKDSVVYRKCCDKINTKAYTGELNVVDPLKYFKETVDSGEYGSNPVLDCNKEDRDDRLCNNNNEWNNPRKSCTLILRNTTCSKVPKYLHRTEGFKKCCPEVVDLKNKEECFKTGENTVVCRDDNGNEKVYVHNADNTEEGGRDTFDPRMNKMINDMSQIVEKYYRSPSGSLGAIIPKSKSKDK